MNDVTIENPEEKTVTVKFSCNPVYPPNIDKMAKVILDRAKINKQSQSKEE